MIRIWIIRFNADVMPEICNNGSFFVIRLRPNSQKQLVEKEIKIWNFYILLLFIIIIIIIIYY